ncbi:MAG: chromosomal replication initiator protein DnaA [Candidatus Coproplasma sp.]
MAGANNLDFIYGPIKEKMQEIISPINFISYIDKLVPVEIIDGRYIVLETLTENFAQHITQNLADKMREAIIKADVGISDFKLVVKGSSDYAFDSTVGTPAYTPINNLNKKFTFENFVAGNNVYAYKAALSVADDPAGTYNPLFIYGGTGLGKTHLTQAIANHVLSATPSAKVIYVTCEQFVNEFINSMLTKGAEARERGNQLRQYYRSADVLIIDDIQFIIGKTAVQEEFFHTFNELVSRNKQIIITSDQHPKQLTTLQDRLKTRFQGGLVVDMVPPDYETKIAILKVKALEKRTIVPDEVLAFLAQDSGDDVRTLEGRLTKVIFASKLHEEPISVELARSALKEAVSEGGNEEITPASIISAVAGFYGVTKEEIIGKCKKAEIVVPRQVCCYLMCELLSLPLMSIGKELGNRNHTTILYSRDKVSELMTVNDKLSKEIDDIKNIILKK